MTILPTPTLASALLATMLLAMPAAANSVSVDVPASADLWLASQPGGTILDDGYPSYDIAPANSPVLASVGLSLAAGSPLTIVATGAVDYGGCGCATPDGGDPCGSNLMAREFFGISGYIGPINALVGAFLDDSAPIPPAPLALDFSTPAAQAQLSFAPELNQVFFVGDGLTGTGTGAAQLFVVPPGATRLFLGSSDGPGANYNNVSSFAVTVSDDLCLHRADVVTLLPHSPPRAAVYVVPPTAEDLSLNAPAYQCPFNSGDLEQDASALDDGIALSLYQINRAITMLRLTKSARTIRFDY